MSRIYDLELSCGCLIGTEDNIYMPCFKDDCKADEEYFNKVEKSKEVMGEWISLISMQE